MITDRYLQLMNGEIDGVNSPEESRSLAAYLQESEEARCYYAELRAAIGLLEDTPPCEMPTGLHQSIMDATAAAAAVGTRAAGPWLLRKPGYAYAFAAGLVVGMVLLGAVWPRLQSGQARALRDLYGSVAPEAAFVRDLVIDEPAVAGRVRFGFTADQVTIRVDLKTENKVRLELNHDESLFVEDLRVLGPVAPGLTTETGRLTLDDAGRGICEIVLGGGTAARRPLVIALRLEGSLLIERVIEPE